MLAGVMCFVHPNVDLHTLPDSAARDKHFAVFHVKHLRNPTLDLSLRVGDGRHDTPHCST